jgi:hypothetical protein
VSDQVYGTGLTNPCIATAVGTFTGGAGTVTLSLPTGGSCGTVSVGETLTFQVALFATEVFDQTSNGHHWLQATTADQPQFLFDCLNSTVACLASTTSAQFMQTSANFTPTSGNATLSMEYGRLSGTGTSSAIAFENSTGGNRFQSGTANHVLLAGNSNFSVTASDGVMHAINALLEGASSELNVDGTDTSGSATGNTTAGKMGGFGNGSSTTTLYGEIGFWDNNTSASRTGLCHNQYLFYANATSC